jgi:predicted DsbA family dithiol-disulfide isomerase
MKVDIWSDVMCPFCYIGKRRFEVALANFNHKEDIEVVWHSFQLDPEMTAQPGKDVYTYLAERKGISVEQSKQMHTGVVQMAREAGLEYNFDTAVIANSFDAHRFAHLAKTKGLGEAAEEALFKAYFTDGKDISNFDTLAQLGTGIGLDAAEVRATLNSDAFANAVDEDIYHASQIGVRGVPFFVLNDKYAVSGAQPAETFAGALNQAWAEYEKENPKLMVLGSDAATCEPGGDCI